jgi:hypothetical protein
MMCLLVVSSGSASAVQASGDLGLLLERFAGERDAAF